MSNGPLNIWWLKILHKNALSIISSDYSYMALNEIMKRLIKNIAAL